MTSQFQFGRPYDFYELLVDGIVHGIGVAFALIGATALIFYATLWGGGGEQIAVWIYSLGLVLALGISFAYNMLPHSRFKWVMRRFDHSAIFILIAATYTPLLQQGIDDPQITALLAWIWSVALLGIVLKCVFPGRGDRLAVLLYLAMGWSGLIAIGPISGYLPGASMWLVVIGGLIYSAGISFHLWEKLRFQNAIWHSFVIAAAAVHYSAIFTALHLGRM
ncbi:PAQR family membrane homeostasis protein TrhA [Paracoccus saliphilus]|uniref:Hemolysin III n=1 Tax=Paracoccus saliphilus TaxID=405559 RepID=A0AA45W4D9_9RHOB|nr:hemolysin III family protein [Paracoccus saliphilus]WCR04058.1 hemolysin III family protein [Paracoccus saliphilus]SIS84391.1 hemolysin III [Paracoccus saliphilus]